MKDEGKKFLDGILVGGIVGGFLISLVFAFLMFQSEQHSTKKIGIVPEDSRQVITREMPAQQTELELEKPEIKDAEFGDEVVFEGETYLLLQLLKDKTGEKYLRVLAENNAAAREHIEREKNPDFTSSWTLPNISQEASQACFNGDTVFGDKTFGAGYIAGDLIFTVWDMNGERLISSDDTLTQRIAQAPNGCVTATEWIGDQIAFQALTGDAGISIHEVMLYEPVSGEITQILEAYSRTLYTEDFQFTDELQTVWLSPFGSLSQVFNWKDEVSKNIFRHGMTVDEFTEFDQLDTLTEDKRAFQTSAKAETVLGSQENLQDYQEGLHFIIAGEKVFIPWNQNM